MTILFVCKILQEFNHNFLRNPVERQTDKTD